jgi:DNA-binding NtrC family response regulator
MTRILTQMTDAANDTIVVIEGHPEYLEHMTKLLRRAGYRVAGFCAAPRAMRHIASDATSLVITDVFMPDMDGFEVLRELKRLGRDIPVIAVTGIDPRHALFLDAMRHMGARATFTKPIEAELLLATVAHLIGVPELC